MPGLRGVRGSLPEQSQPAEGFRVLAGQRNDRCRAQQFTMGELIDSVAAPLGDVNTEKMACDRAYALSHAIFSNSSSVEY